MEEGENEKRKMKERKRERERESAQCIVGKKGTCIKGH